MDVGQRLVLAVLGEAGHDCRLPALGQFLQRGDIQITVVEECLELRHVPGEKTAVLADGIAAHRRRALRQVLRQESNQFRFDFCLILGCRLCPVDQAGFLVRGFVP